MILRKTTFHYLILTSSLLLSTFVAAQNTAGGNALVYTPPTQEFHPIKLQEYKGLARFGILNNYRKKNSAGIYPRRQDPATLQKFRTVGLSYQNYFKMVAFKYLADIYKDMDRDRLTKMPPNNTPGKQKNSYDAQKYLRSLLTLCVEDNCKNGLNGANEFERLRNYKNFVNTYLDDLSTWSTDFFTDNSIIGYDVSSMQLGNYDFDKNGYWAYLNLNISVGNYRDPTILTVFKPKAPYENDLLNKAGANRRGQISGLQIFLAISPEEAEKLQLNNVRNLYVVKKVKLTFKEVTSGYKTGLNMAYHHEDATIEIYEDLALTKKMATLSLDNLITKKP